MKKEGLNPRDYEQILDEYKTFKTDILDWEAKKRDKVENVIKDLSGIKLNIKKIQKGIAENYTLDNVIEDIDKSINDLETVYEKYNYSKLPRN